MIYTLGFITIFGSPLLVVDLPSVRVPKAVRGRNLPAVYRLCRQVLTRCRCWSLVGAYQDRKREARSRMIRRFREI